MKASSSNTSGVLFGDLIDTASLVLVVATVIAVVVCGAALATTEPAVAVVAAIVALFSLALSLSCINARIGKRRPRPNVLRD